MRYLYLDHAATTPVSPPVLEAMLPYFTRAAGNPSSTHAAGRAAHDALETARARTAAAIGAEAREIFFTSGGTESDNWAVKGTALAALRRGRDVHIITTAIEHHAVLRACEALERQGVRVTRLPVDGFGRVDPAEAERAIGPDTALISVMAVNNEIGTIQPIREIGRIARAHGIPFHTDAVQAIGYLPVDVNDWQADLLSLSAHKFRGPKGVGALYVRRGFLPETLLHGGAQERGRRAGTENVPGIVGLGCAIAAAAAAQPEATARLTALRDRLIRGVLDAVPGSRLIGHPTLRQAGNANLSFPGVDQEILLRQLELRGILASAGAACSSGQTEPSHVLAALGLDWEAVTGAIRFSLGTETTGEDIETALAEIPAAVQDARAVQGL